MEAKREIRRKWCKEQFAHVIESKSHEESYTQIDSRQGTWHTFGSLVRELGGWKWEPAIVGAKLHFVRAVRMGGRWVKKDNMSSLLMVLRLQPVYQEIMENKWARFTKFHNQKNEKSIDDANKDMDTDTDNGKHTNAGKQRTTGKGKGKSNVQSQGHTPHGKAKPVAKKKPKASPRKDATEEENGEDDLMVQLNNQKANALKELNKECQKIKATLKIAQADGGNLLQAFGSDPSYAWGANNNMADKALKTALENDLALSTFEGEFMMNSFQALQKRYGVEFLTSNLEAFKAKKEKVDQVMALVNKLLKMHASSKDA